MREELVGKKMEVTMSRNKSLVGITGTIVDETKHTLVVDTGEARKTILKGGSEFNIDGTIIPGDGLVGRPEDRVKT